MATSMFGMKKRKKHHEEDYEKNQATTPNKGFFSKNPSEGKEHVRVRAEGFSKHEGVTPKMEPHMKSRLKPREEQEEEDSYHTSRVPTGRKQAGNNPEGSSVATNKNKATRKNVAMEMVKRKMKRY